MSIKYELHYIINAQGTGENRRFVRLFEQPPLSDHQLKKEIQSSCTLTVSDLEGTLSALRAAMIRELSQGKRFHIPSIGYFSLSVDSDIPDDTPEEKMRGDYIKVRNINFRPDAALLQEIRSDVRFERATFSTQSRKQTEAQLQEKIEEFLSTHNFLTRRDLEMHFGLRQTTALKYLRHFTETGFLKKEGHPNAPVYTLNKERG